MVSLTKGTPGVTRPSSDSAHPDPRSATANAEPATDKIHFILIPAMAIKAKGCVKPLLHALGLMSTLTLVRHRRMVARWIGQSARAQGLVEPPKSRTTVEMSTKLKEFLQRWLITTVAVLVATQVVKRIHYDNWQGLLAATLLLGFLN